MAFHVSVQAGVATFTLDNPPHNRLSTELVLGCAAAIEQAADDLMPALAGALLRTGDAQYGVASAVKTDEAGIERAELDFSGR